LTLVDLGILYTAAGAVSALVIHRRSKARGRQAFARALLAIPLWPLWLPVALARADDWQPNGVGTVGGTAAALVEGHEAVRGTALEALLPRDLVDRMLGEIRRASERRDELALLLARPSFGLDNARAHVERLGREGASARTLASARLHLANVEQLDALRRRDELALDELGELASALRTQLVLARYRGATAEGVGDIVNEVWARVEVLGTTMDEVPSFLDT
jgi:hypothetical protein